VRYGFACEQGGCGWAAPELQRLRNGGVLGAYNVPDPDRRSISHRALRHVLADRHECRSEMPNAVLELMTLYPQPVRAQSGGVEYVPVPRQKKA
jgi:hypothetical protein